MDKRDFVLSVIIAEEMAIVNLPEIFEILQPDHYPTIEFLVCSASDQSLLENVPKGHNIRVIPAQLGSRIPLLWRDGIREAKAERVALTTAQCIPSQTWLKQLAAYTLTDELVAIGGAIEDFAGNTSIGRMIYLLRYVRYTKARPCSYVEDLAADNAIYRKADILAYDNLLEIGFWEPTFHERFIADGKKMKFDNELIVVHKNCYSTKQFVNQRYSHGVEFGMARAKLMSVTKRFIMIALSPLIPFVFIRKIMVRAKLDKQFDLGLNRDFFWLTVFVLAWSAGETAGYIKSRSRKP